MRIVLANGNVVTGDGKSVLERSSVVIQDKYIVDVLNVPYVYDSRATRSIDVNGDYIIPGVINHHAHGVAFGPFGAIGEKPIPRERVINNLNKLMLQGTTTILNADGFATMEEVDTADKIHPINIKTGTIHTPLNIKAAELADGKGLTEGHKKLTVKRQLNLGAVAIAEVGSGATLGGAKTDYMLLPDAVREKTGVCITTPQAKALKEAVLTRHIIPEKFDPDKTAGVLKELRVDKHLSVDEAKQLVTETVMPAYTVGLKAIEEAAELSAKFNIPMEVHNASGSMDTVYKISKELGNRLIAGHSNHSSFELKECLMQAKRLKECGVIVDVSTLDCLGARQIVPSPEMIFAMMEDGLVDILSTDYGGGFWDSELLLMQKIVEEGILNIPQVVAMGTRNVAKAFPKLAPNRGIIASGNTADLAVVNGDRIGVVNMVIIGGKITVEDGRIKQRII